MATHAAYRLFCCLVVGIFHAAAIDGGDLAQICRSCLKNTSPPIGQILAMNPPCYTLLFTVDMSKDIDGYDMI